MSRWAIQLPEHSVDPQELVSLGRDLEAAGFASVWMGETASLDAVAVLALLGTATQRLQIGSAVLPAFTRTPALLAMGASTLARAFPGRVHIGIGASSAVIVERWNGVPFERPFSRVRDTLRFLRSALGGEKISREFESFSIRGFRLASPPETPPRLLVGATSPRMLEFALAEADGVILNWLTASDVASLADQRGECPTYCLLPTYVIEDRERVHEQARPFVAQYLSVPAYARQQRRFGRAERLAPVWEAWERGDHAAAAAALDPGLIDQLIVHGSPAACREQIAEFARISGATPLVVPLGQREPLLQRILAVAPDAG